MFVHLHGHGTYSMLEGIGTVKSILAKAQSLSMSAIAITDYYGLYGAIEFYRIAKDLGINAIVGVELGFVESIQTSYSHDTIGNIVLLAKDNEGYENLLQLVSLAHQHQLRNKPSIDFALLTRYSQGLIGFMGGSTSALGTMILQGESESSQKDFGTKLLNVFGSDNFYGEIVAQDYDREPSLQKINDALTKLSDNVGFSLIVTSNFHYVDESDKAAFELALAIKDGHKMYDEDRRKIVGDYHIFTENEIISTLEKNGFSQNHIHDLLSHTALVAEKCVLKLDLYQSLFPNYQAGNELVQLYEANKDSMVEAT